MEDAGPRLDIFKALHSETAEVLRFSEASLLTAGLDGRIVSSHVGPSTAEAVFIHRLAAITAAAVSSDGKLLAVCQDTDTGFGVWTYSLNGKAGRPGSEAPKLAARFTLEVRHLCWHPVRPLLGIAADDGKLLVYDREAEGNRRRCKEFPTGTSGGAVRCVAFAAASSQLACALASGALVIFWLDDATELYRQQMVWPKVVTGSSQLLIAWKPEGSVLALPGESLRLLNRTAGNSMEVLAGGHRCSTTAVAWSACGTLLVSVSAEALALWQDSLLLKTFAMDVAPRSLRWNRAGQRCAVGLANGDVLCLTVGTALAPAPAPAPESQVKEEASAPPTEESLPQSEVAVESQDPGVGSQPPEVCIADSKPKDATWKAPVVQLSFQPGATSDRRRRFLAAGEHGYLTLTLNDENRQRKKPRIEAMATSGGTGSIGTLEVDYTRERRRVLAAAAGLELGAIGPGLAALSIVSGNEASIRIHFANAAPGRPERFEHVLPAGESVKALAVGRTFVAAATLPQRLLRIISTSSNAIAVVALTGTPVCLAAQEDLLLCVVRAPAPAWVREPSLEYSLRRVSSQECLASGRLPLSRGSHLRWVGFSAEALPLTLDSAGVLRGLALCGHCPAMSGVADWIPLAELEGRAAKLWPVRAEAGLLHCAEVARAGDEPRAHCPLTLKPFSFSLPLGVEAEAAEKLLNRSFLEAHLSLAQSQNFLQARSPMAKPGRSPACGENHQALSFFKQLTKSDDLEQALDVAEHYFMSFGTFGTDRYSQEVRLTQQAVLAASEKPTGASAEGFEVLFARLQELLDARREKLQALTTEQRSKENH